MLYVVGALEGVTQLDDIVYVVRYKSPIIEMYSVDTLSPLGEGIHVEGMKHPRDIVACQRDRQLYVADYNYGIWRVSTKDKSFVKWLPTESATQKFRVETLLSLTSQGLLVASFHPPALREYSTENGEPMRHVTLPQYMWQLYHAVETTHGRFVMSHQGTSERRGKDAVSELFRFCHTLTAASSLYKYIDIK